MSSTTDPKLNSIVILSLNRRRKCRLAFRRNRAENMRPLEGRREIRIGMSESVSWGPCAPLTLAYCDQILNPSKIIQIYFNCSGPTVTISGHFLYN